MRARTALYGIGRLAIAAMVLIGCVVAGYLYLAKQLEVRRRLDAELAERFSGVEIEYGSMRLRPFAGGISISDFRLRRRDDPNQTPLLTIPNTTIYLTKDEFRERFLPSKLEFEGAVIRLVRDTQGKWNFEGIVKPKDSKDTLPTLVLRKAVIEVIDLQVSPLPLARVTDVDLTLINDPMPKFVVDFAGKSPLGAAIRVKGSLDRNVGGSATIDLQGVKLGADLARLIRPFRSDAADVLAPIEGTVGVSTTIRWRPDRVPAISYDTTLDLTDGTFFKPDLPYRFDQVKLKARCQDGVLTIDELKGKLGEALIDVKVDLAAPSAESVDPESPFVMPRIDPEAIRSLEVNAKNVLVTKELFDRFPANYADIQDMFQPSGPADVTYVQRIRGEGTERRATLHCRGMDANYRGFRYPLEQVRGTVVMNFDDPDARQFQIDLTGDARGRPITLKGSIISGADHRVDLTLTGKQVKLDKPLVDALPDRFPEFVRSLRATAEADFSAKIRHNAKIRRDHGPEIFDNEFDIRILDGSIFYDEFPYPLRKLRGNLLIRTVPDQPSMVAPAPGLPPAPAVGEIGSARFKEFSAIGPGDCQLNINGNRSPQPGGQILQFDVKGENVPLDGEMFRAISKLRLDQSWRAFEPGGRMNCEIDVRIHDRIGSDGRSAPFVPARDLELGLSFNGPTLRPTFFAYQMTDCSGQLGFARGRVELIDFRGRHGDSRITLPQTEVLLPPGGGVWADMYDLKVNPLIVDNDLVTAMPEGLRRAIIGLELKGPMAVHFRRMVVDDTPKKPPVDRIAAVTPSGSPGITARGAAPLRGSLPTIYWDGSLIFRDASMNTGVTWEKMTGQLSSRGLYANDKLNRTVANLAVDQATILKQPVRMISARFEVDPKKPEIVEVPWINASLYGGEVGGQARLVLGAPVRFDLVLNGSRMKLEEVARINKMGPKTHLEGNAVAQLTLSNPIDVKTGKPRLEGSGSIDVVNGKLLDVPGVVRLLKLVRLRPVDDVFFEEAHVLFRIRGDRVKIGQLDLLGNAVSLGGEGEMNLDGTRANLEFYTVWTNIRNILGVSGEIPARISGALYKIHVAGDLADDKLEMKPQALSGIVDPVRRMIGRAAR